MQIIHLIINNKNDKKTLKKKLISHKMVKIADLLEKKMPDMCSVIQPCSVAVFTFLHSDYF